MKDILNERQKDKNKIIKRRKDEKINTPSRQKKGKDQLAPTPDSELTVKQQMPSDQKNPFDVVEEDPLFDNLSKKSDLNDVSPSRPRSNTQGGGIKSHLSQSPNIVGKGFRQSIGNISAIVQNNEVNRSFQINDGGSPLMRDRNQSSNLYRSQSLLGTFSQSFLNQPQRKSLLKDLGKKVKGDKRKDKVMTLSSNIPQYANNQNSQAINQSSPYLKIQPENSKSIPRNKSGSRERSKKSRMDSTDERPSFTK